MDFDFITTSEIKDDFAESRRRSQLRRLEMRRRRLRRRVGLFAVAGIVLASLGFGLPRALQPSLPKAEAGQAAYPLISSQEVTPQPLSPRGLRFIARMEGFFPEVYNDPAGHCTIGYGTLLHLGACTEADRLKWGRLSRSEALALMRQELMEMSFELNRLVRVGLTSGQRDALMSFTYNCGVSALRRSTLLSLLNQRRYRQAADQLLRWDKASGQVLPGLVKRRAAERLMFLQG